MTDRRMTLLAGRSPVTTMRTGSSMRASAGDAVIRPVCAGSSRSAPVAMTNSRQKPTALLIAPPERFVAQQHTPRRVRNKEESGEGRNAEVECRYGKRKFTIRLPAGGYEPLHDRFFRRPAGG